MISTVKTRLNHYELLGLKPSASDEEIAQAFARAMRLPHLMTEVAQIGIAFDTLRNRAKRRAYDEALGLWPEPKPVPAPPAMSFRISARLAALASPGPIEPAGAVAVPRPVDPLHRPALPMNAEVRSETLEPLLQPVIPDFPTPSGVPAGDSGDRAIDWKYPAFAIGFVVLAVVLIGAWAGAHAQDSDVPKQPEPAMAVAHPAGRPMEKALDVVGARASREPAAERASAAPISSVASHVRHAPEPRRTTDSGDRLAEVGRSTEGAPSEVAPAAGPSDLPGAAPASAVAATLPLPKALIARTIEHIGYSCGAIASATAVEGEAPGVYKITCTSGQSYQAKPVRGRYHFRRW